MNPRPAPEAVSGSQTLTVSTVAVTLTIPANANHARIQVLSAAIRCWSDGTTPTASSGKQGNVTDQINLWGAELKNFKAIREGATDASLQVSYYKAGYESAWGS